MSRGGRLLAAPAAVLVGLGVVLAVALTMVLGGGPDELGVDGLVALAPGDEPAEFAGELGAAAAPDREEPLANAASGARVELAPPRAPAALEADAGVPLRGLVLASETHEPLGDARVRLIGDDWESVATSDAEGLFELRRLEGSAPALEATCAGYALGRRPGVPEDGELVIELRPEARIEGQVIGLALEALQGAGVSLWDLADDRNLREPGEEVELASDGTFAFGGLRAGEYTVGAALPGFAIAYEAGISVEPGEVARVTLEPRTAATLRGVVRARATEDTLAGVEVRATLRLRGVGGGLEELGEVVTVTDAEGAYELAGLSLGPYRLEALAPWDSRVGVSVTVEEEGAELERDLQLELPASLAGNVMNGAGLGVAGAVVELRWDEALVEGLMEGEAGVEAGERTARCDLNGRFRFEELPAGRWLRILAYRTHTEGTDEVELLGRTQIIRLRSDEDREDLTLRIEEPNRVTGEVRDPFGQPLAGVELTVSRRLQSRGKRSKGPSTIGHSRAVTDEDGDFELVGLLPGAYELRAEGALLFPRVERFSIPAPPAAPVPVEFTMERGEALSGWVVDELGDAVPNATVSAQLVRAVDIDVPASKRVRERADGFGRFSFDVIEAGMWELKAAASGYVSPDVGVLTRTEAGLFVELELERTDPVGTATVRGTVRATDGRELKGLRFEPLRGGVYSIEDGRFELAGTRAGETSFRLSAEGYVTHSTGPLRLLADGEVDLGFIALSPAGTVRVFAADSKGKPLKDFTARLTRKGAPSGARSLRLGLGNAKHRYKGAKNRVDTKVARSSQVPLGTWILRVSAAGQAATTREIALTGDARSKSVEVRLGAPKASKKKTQVKGKGK